jgi:serine/threonine protein kinase
MLPADHNKFPRRLGPYVVLQLLGEGGMGSAYLALMGKKGSERFCVIKQMGSTWSDFGPEHLPEIRQRFQHEADLTMALDHSGIPRTLAVGDDEVPYLVQEFVDGINLGHLVPGLVSAGEALSIPLASHIVVEVARILAYLHDFEAKGLVHRDVTPENIMLTTQGEVKLIDFGVAKATACDEGLSQRGMVGKAHWLAPELFHGAALDRRADLYALGVVYWHLLTHLDPGASQSRRVGPHEAFPAPSTFNLKVCPELDFLVAKATHADPILRFQTADELAEAVRSQIPRGFAGKEDVVATVRRHSRREWEEQLPRLLKEGRSLLDPPIAMPRRAGKGEAAARLFLPTLLVLGAAVALVGLFIVIVKSRRIAESPAVASVPATLSAQPQKAEPGPASGNRPTAIGSQPSVLSAPSHAVDTTTHKTISTEPEPVLAPVVPPPSAEEILASAKESFEQSDIAKALLLARRAAEQGAGASAYVLMGSCLSIQKDFAGAQDALRQALRISPKNAEAKRLLERLRNGVSDDVP